MRALVTGGAGFIGSNLVKELVEGGHEVVVLDNLLSGYRANLIPFPGVLFIEGDIRDREAVDDAMQGVDWVFHHAASVGNKRSIDEPGLDSSINVLGTIEILEACRRHSVRKIVTASSAGIFGELLTMPIDENHPVEPDSPYGCSKLAKEKLCLAYSKLYDLDAVCLRYFNVYGPNQRFDAYGNVIPIFVFQALRGEQVTIFGDGEQTRDFINVRDVVQANLKAAAVDGLSGAFNLGSASRVTINRLLEIIGEVMEQEIPPAYGPERPGDVRHSMADVSAAARNFGFEPGVDLLEGLREYVAWARTEVQS